MNRFDILVEEFKEKLGRELSDKELKWVLWVVNQEKRGKGWNS
ncbi:hypothetical protein [Virgibacillus dakarensis]|nr:hypothetical protein [Virgibacillus dakarensis]